jgi:hypothetical protein
MHPFSYTSYTSLRENDQHIFLFFGSFAVSGSQYLPDAGAGD